MINASVRILIGRMITAANNKNREYKKINFHKIKFGKGAQTEFINFGTLKLYY